MSILSHTRRERGGWRATLGAVRPFSPASTYHSGIQIFLRRGHLRGAGVDDLGMPEGRLDLGPDIADRLGAAAGERRAVLIVLEAFGA